MSTVLLGILLLRVFWIMSKNVKSSFFPSCNNEDSACLHL